MFATLSIDPSNERLICVCFGVTPGRELTYELVDHDRVVSEAIKTTSPSHHWDLSALSERGGTFYAKVTTVAIAGEAVTLQSESQYVAGKELRDAYDSWLAEGATGEGIELPRLTRANRPYESVAVIQFLSPHPEESTFSLTDIASSLGGVVFPVLDGMAKIGQLTAAGPGELSRSGGYVITSAPGYVSGSSVSFGSGYAFDGTVLRRGSETGATLCPRAAGGWTHAQFASQKSGNFAAAVMRADGHIEFHTDYLGAAAWYEYRSDTLRIMATSYLIAVFVARACGETLSLDLRTIDIDLTSLTQPFQQPLSSSLQMTGFSCLRPDTVVVLAPDGIERRERSQLGWDLATPERFTRDRYDELLAQAAEEIVANCQAIANEPTIKSIRCDISGGLDSRLVLAGFLAGPPENREKLSLFTAANSPTAGDENIAVLVSEATGVKFSDATDIVTVGPCSAEHLARVHIASAFGVYWHGTHNQIVKWDPSHAFVSGSSIDNLGRDYSTKTWNLKAVPVEDPREVSIQLAQQVFKWRGRATLKPAPSHGVTAIARSWDSLPGDELDKGAQVFNFHRARFHGGGTIPASLGIWRIAPGPTRALHQLRQMAGRIMSGPGIQLGLIHHISPELAAVPYANPINNATYTSMFGPMRTDLVGDPEALEESRQLRRRAANWDKCPECVGQEVSPTEHAEVLTEMVRRALRDLGRDRTLYAMMLPAFKFAHHHLGSTYGVEHSLGKTFANKILHIHAMWRMTTSSHSIL